MNATNVKIFINKYKLYIQNELNNTKRFWHYDLNIRFRADFIYIIDYN